MVIQVNVDTLSTPPFAIKVFQTYLKKKNLKEQLMVHVKYVSNPKENYVNLLSFRLFAQIKTIVVIVWVT